MKYQTGSLLSLFLLLIVTLPGQAQERTVTGTVLDSVSEEPVRDVTVQVQGTDLGTLTDPEGRFVLRGVPSQPLSLVISQIGYQNREIRVPADQNSVTVRLRRDYLQIEQLVVTGRATEVRRENLANSVSTLNSEEINETPQQTLNNALQGKVAGALISKNEGTPGGGMQLRLRGSNTINARSTPLYVVDGVLISNFSIGDNRGVLVDGGQGEGEVPRVADLAPGEIESIEILKGPSAAAIYGSKAANGVVIIETKSGTAGEPLIQLSSRFGFFDLLNTIDTRDFTSVDEARDVFGPLVEEEPIASNIEQGGDFDNQEQMASRNDLSYDLSGNIRGGNASTNYYVSGSLKNDEGIIENTGFERQSVRANIASGVGEALDFNVNLNYIHTEQLRGLTQNDNNQTSYWMVFPNVPDFFDLGRRPDGSFPENPFVGNGSNPLQTASLLENEEDVQRFIAGVNGNLALLDTERQSLQLRVNGGVDVFAQENSIFSPPAIFFEDADGRPGTALKTTTNNVNANINVSGIWELQATDDIQLTTSSGLQFETRAPRFTRIVSRDLVAGKPIVDAGTIEQVVERREQVEDFGFFLQEEMLALDDRLLLTGAVRFDQSSANSDDDAIFIYPKASASYRIPGASGFLDEVKFRAAFGQTGNQPVFGQEFTNLDITGKISGIPFLSLEGSFAGELEPERQSEVEGGVDITAAGGRAGLEITGYWQNISNLILQRDLPPSTGFDTEFFNGGEMRNWGIEVSLDATPVAGEFEWSTRTNFFLNRNEVTELPVAPFFTGNFAVSFGGFQVEEGQSLTSIVGTAGTDADGNAIIERLGNSDPDFTITVSQEVTWKGLRLHALGEWRQGQDVINLTELLFDLAANSADFVDQDGEISPPGECFPDCSGTERIVGFANGFARPYVQDASFFKLREVSLSWELPTGLRQDLFGNFFRNVRLTATANELFRITPYRGLDPEVSQFGITPFRGVDIAPFPPSRSFFVGVDLSL